MSEMPQLPPVRRPGVRAWVRLIVVEVTMVFRDPAGLIIPIGLPLLIMVMNGLNAADQAPMDALGGLRPFDAVVVPLTLAMVVALVGLANMPSFLATYRRTGVLRRLAVTPAHPAMVLIAQVVVSALQTAAGVVLALAVGVLAFDLAWPADHWATGGVLLVGAACFYALGTLIAAVAPTTNSAIAIGMLLFFAMLALGGGLGPVDALPDGVRTTGELLPFGAATQALSATWMGEPVEVAHLGALAGTAVVASTAAARWFRWE